MMDMNNLMKQAAKLQQELLKKQEELSQKEVIAEVGGGMVKVVANGRQEIVSVLIDDEVLREEKDIIEDLILSAVNEALRLSKEMMEKEMGKLTGGLNIPGLGL